MVWCPNCSGLGGPYKIALKHVDGHVCMWIESVDKASFMGIHWNPWRSKKICETLWKSRKIYENQWNPWTCMGYICLGERRWVILYLLRIETPHTSVLQRELNCLSREDENQGFRETWTLTCGTRVKVMIFIKTWHDPTVITDVSPQSISRKTPIEVKILTKVLKSVFSSMGFNFETLFDNLT